MNVRRSGRRFRPFERKNAVAPVVATLLLIIVVVTAVGTFAFFLSGLQTQAQKVNDKLQGVQNESLQVAYAQFYPIDWGTPNITSVFVAIQNLNSQASG